MSTIAVNSKNVLETVKAGDITGRNFKRAAKCVAARLGATNYLRVEEFLAGLVASGEVVYENCSLRATTEQERSTLAQSKATHLKGLRKRSCRGTRVRGCILVPSTFSPEDLAEELAAQERRRHDAWPEYFFGYKHLLETRLMELIEELSKEPEHFRELVSA